MSTLRVDNFGPSAGGTSYSARGIAKAWMNLNGTGTIAVRDSVNTSSVTDLGVSIYQQNFASPMANGDYAVAHGQTMLGGGGSFGGVDDPILAASVTTRSRNNNTGAVTDESYSFNAIFGDLA